MNEGYRDNANISARIDGVDTRIGEINGELRALKRAISAAGEERASTDLGENAMIARNWFITTCGLVVIVAGMAVSGERCNASTDQRVIEEARAKTAQDKLAVEKAMWEKMPAKPASSTAIEYIPVLVNPDDPRWAAQDKLDPKNKR